MISSKQEAEFLQEFQHRFGKIFPELPEVRIDREEGDQSRLYYWPLEKSPHQFFFLEFCENELVAGTQSENQSFFVGEDGFSGGRRSVMSEAFDWLERLFGDQILTVIVYRKSTFWERGQKKVESFSFSLENQSSVEIVEQLQGKLKSKEWLEAFTWSKRYS